MRHQVRAHFGLRLDNPRKGLLPGLQDRVRFVPGVQIHRAVVGIHHRFHRVAHVVHLVLGQRKHVGGGSGNRVGCGVVEVDSGGVGVLLGAGVGVLDPDDTPIDHRRVGVAVRREPWGNFGQPLPRRAVPHDLRLRVHQVRQQDVRLAELRRKHQLVQWTADRYSADTVVGVVALAGRAGVVGKVDFPRLRPLRSTHDRVHRRVLPEVHPRLRDIQVAFRRDIEFEEIRRAIAVGSVVIRRDEAVPVGVHNVVVCPVALRVRDAGQVEFPHGHHSAALFAVDRVAIHVQVVRERVEAADLLQSAIGGRHDCRIEQSDVFDRGGIGRDRLRVGLLGRGIFAGLYLVESVGRPRRSNVAGQVLLLFDQFTGTHLELLHDGRIDAADHQRRGRHQYETRDRDPPD